MKAIWLLTWGLPLLTVFKVKKSISMHVSRNIYFYKAKPYPHIEIKKKDECWNIINVRKSDSVPLNKINFLCFNLPLLRLCSLPVREQNATGIVRGGTVLPALLLCTHLKLEVMEHFRRLLLHTPNCQYTVITKGPPLLKEALLMCAALWVHWGFIDDNLTNTTMWFNVLWHLCFSQTRAADLLDLSARFTHRTLPRILCSLTIHLSTRIFSILFMRKHFKHIQR